MIVTRYLGSHLAETLATSELKVAKVSEFNDPFEFRFRYDGEYGRSEAIRDFKTRLNTPEYWQRFQEDPRFSGQTYDEIIKLLENKQESILEALIEDAKSGHKSTVDSTHQAADDTTRIICFSIPTEDPNKDMLRWSHYTNCHKGARMWLDLSKQPAPLNIGFEVDYKNDFITIDVARGLDTDYNRKIQKKVMVTKASCWEYEGEVRSFIPAPFYTSHEIGGAVNDFVRFNPEGVMRIDFGIRFPREEAIQIIDAHRSQLAEDVKFFQATKSYSEYRIEYKEIEVEQGG